jgi:hypothetical protein
MSSITQKEIDKFWGKVDKEKSTTFYNGTRCWEWKSGAGRYGYVRLVGRNWRVNRASWTISHGEIQKGLHVLHHCDNTKCVNPAHLFLGTQKENVYDMIAKGRKWIGSGEDNPNSKVTIEQVEEIRRLYKRQSRKGLATGGLAKRFGISKSQVWSILKKQSWKS